MIKFQTIWLVFPHFWETDSCCPLCQRAYSDNRKQKYLVTEAEFDTIEEDCNIVLNARFFNPKTTRYNKIAFTHYYIHDCMNDEEMKKFWESSIYDLEPYDEGPFFFRTEEEANNFVKEYLK